MIKLNTDDYCENCPDFDPHLDQTICEDFYGENIVTNIVSCKHQSRCIEIARYIEAQKRRSENNGR